jgi:hypothetical protein
MENVMPLSAAPKINELATLLHADVGQFDAPAVCQTSRMVSRSASLAGGIIAETVDDGHARVLRQFHYVTMSEDARHDDVT